MKSQNTVFSESIFLTKNYKISGDTKNADYNKIVSITNPFLFELDFKIDLEIQLKIQRIDSPYFKVIVEAKNFNIEKENYFKGFDLSNFIKPDCFDYSVSLFRVEDENDLFIKNFYSENQIIADRFGYYLLHDEIIQLSEFHSKHFLKLNFFDFCISDKNKQEFVKVLENILEYHKTAHEIEDIRLRLRNIDTKDYGRVRFNRIIINQLEQEISNLENNELFNILNIRQNDPLNLLAQINDLKTNYSQIQITLENYSNQIETLLYKRGKEFIEQGNIILAKENFEKALEFNKSYSPALFELALIDIEESNFISGLNRINLAMNFSNYENIEYYLKKWQISSLKINKYIQEKIEQQKYSDIDDIVFLYKDLCTYFPSLNCFENSNKFNSTVIRGFYNSYLTVVEKAIEHKKFEIAKSYILLSVEYQQNNKQIISDSSEAIIFYPILFNSCVSEIASLLKLPNVNKAYEHLVWLNDFCKEININYCKNLYEINKRFSVLIANQRLELAEQDILKKNFDQADVRLLILNEMLKPYYDISNEQRLINIRKSIEQHRYDVKLQEVISLVKNNQIKEAIDLLISALQKHKEHNLIHNQSLELLYIKPITEFIINELELILKNSYSSNIVNIYNDFNKLKTLAFDLNLSSNQQIFKTISEIESNINKVRNSNNIKELDSLIQLTDSLTKELRFIEADSILDLINSKYLDYILFVGLDQQSFINKSILLSPAISWEYEIRLLRNLKEQSKWLRFLEQAVSINDMVLRKNLGAFGISSLDLISLIKETDNFNLNETAYQYFIEENNYLYALEVLKMLRSKGLSFSKSIKYQRELSVLLAEYDFRKNPLDDFEIRLENYGIKDVYFFYFRIKYLTTIRNLNKNTNK